MMIPHKQRDVLEDQFVRFEISRSMAESTADLSGWTDDNRLIPLSMNLNDDSVLISMFACWCNDLMAESLHDMVDAEFLS